MKERVLSIVSALMMVVPMMAQDIIATPHADQGSENALQNVSVGELNYTVKEQDKTAVETVVGAVLDVLAEQTTTEQPGYADAGGKDIKAALDAGSQLLIISTD